MRDRIVVALDYLDGQRLVLLDEADRLGITLHTLRTADGGYPGLTLLATEATLLRALADVTPPARTTS